MRLVLLVLSILLFAQPCYSRGLGTYRIDDYKVKVFLSHRGKYLVAEGDISGRPKADAMRITIVAKSNDGRTMVFNPVVTDVGRRRSYEQKKRVGRKRSSWHIRVVKLARLVD